ncbi:MAG: PPOX class F420-dependent oxidoreductase [Acidimicrobiia bacterium]
MIPPSHLDLLTRPVLAHAATIDAKGRPQNNPVWIAWDGTYLRFSQVIGRQKEKNLGRNPAITFSLVDPDDPYRYVEIRGVLDGIEDDSSLAFINSMAQKYLGVKRNPWEKPGQRRIIMRIRPLRALTMG